MDYNEIARTIIAAQQDIIGTVALQQAAKLDGIERDGDEITITDDLDASDIDALVDRFEEVTGRAAVGTARRALNKLDLGDLSLPDRLQSD